MTLSIAAKKIEDDLAWRGPGGKPLGHVVLPRDCAEVALAALRRATAIPIDQWKIVVDEPVLIYVVHDHAKYESDPIRRKQEWEGWCVGRWINHNGGGWTWHGHIGRVTHVAPLPLSPDGGGAGSPGQR